MATKRPRASKVKTMQEVHFELEKETSGTFRYKEEGDKENYKIGYLYIKKSTAKTLGNPKKLTVTLAAA